VDCSKEPVEIGKRAKDRINVAVVGNVITKIRHWGREDGRNPQRVDAEVNQIVQPCKDAGQVANAVIVRVLKRTRIHFIDNPALPPCFCLHLTFRYSF